MTSEAISERERGIKETDKYLGIDEVRAEEAESELLAQSHEQQVLWQDEDLNPKTETELCVPQTIWQESELTPTPKPTYSHNVYKQLIEL